MKQGLLEAGAGRRQATCSCGAVGVAWGFAVLLAGAACAPARADANYGVAWTNFAGQPGGQGKRTGTGG